MSDSPDSGNIRNFVFDFSEGNEDMRDLLGGKGANLAAMTRAGLPVPPGFTVTTEACRAYLAGNGVMPEGLEEQIKVALGRLEAATGKRFGDSQRPLLVSVRSGAAISMPGMMDTILNLGLNDVTVEGLYNETGDRRFAFDCYRRFIQMFGDVVLGIPLRQFEQLLDGQKRRRGVNLDSELPADALEQLINEYKELVKEQQGRPFPQDPHEQLMAAIRAVFDSWNNERAVVYRRLHKIPDDLGTAVNVQTMVFGNMGDDSGTGVLFTRNPNTGAKELYGEYLLNAQGEDVVAGIRTPRPVQELATTHPDVYRQLNEVADQLESHYRDMQDIEFTIERGRLFLLQTRSGKRTAAAAVKIAHDMVREGLIDRREALLRIEPEQVINLLHKRVDPAAADQAIARGLPASPGAAMGILVFDPDEAVERSSSGDAVILVRPETTPDDIHGIIAAQGVLTSRGGMTCHAAIVARGMGKPCVVGCDALRIDLDRRQMEVNGRVIRSGERIAIDGATGRVFVGEVPLISPAMSDEFATILSWADEERRLAVLANADTPEDARRAREFGAEGIGLCRTEHMFIRPDRLPTVQQMILATEKEDRLAALDRLLPELKADFIEILESMEGYPVTIRLLDPPLHEFLPDIQELVEKATQLRQENSDQLDEIENLLARVRALHETNPMLGHRGCRLGITFPEIYLGQARALFEATAQLLASGKNVKPEVMIPLVGHVNELKYLRQLIEDLAKEVSEQTGVQLNIPIGTMIEVPRAALTAGEISEAADFFSFGTNDLTQTTFGFSRDDAEAKFMHHYLDQQILPDNPFVTIDPEGVGRLIAMATEEGRRANPDLKVGICGEHGGDPASILLCEKVGLDYVSCSPYRLPVARLAAAKAAILNQ